jgi:hypothetical protein
VQYDGHARQCIALQDQTGTRRLIYWPSGYGETQTLTTIVDHENHAVATIGTKVTITAANAAPQAADGGTISDCHMQPKTAWNVMTIGSAP